LIGNFWAARFARRPAIKNKNSFLLSFTQKSSKKVKPDEFFAAKLRLFFYEIQVALLV
jgi:hypothetical protein